jgi:hypothetical protein
VEGWDLKLLARCIEACAVSLGVLQVTDFRILQDAG